VAIAAHERLVPVEDRFDEIVAGRDARERRHGIAEHGRIDSGGVSRAESVHVDAEDLSRGVDVGELFARRLASVFGENDEESAVEGGL
jgi:hypothetical protein